MDLTVWVAKLVPDHDAPPLQWVLWVVVVLASSALFLRGLKVIVDGIAIDLGRRIAPYYARLPFRFQSPVVRRPGVIPAPDADLGFLDFELAFTSAVTEAVRWIQALSKDLQRGQRITEWYTPRIQKAAGGTPKRRVSVNRDYGVQLGRLAKQIHKHELRYRGLSEGITTNGLAWFKSLPSGTAPEQWAQLETLVHNMTDPVAGALDSRRGYRETIAELRKISVQREVNRSANYMLTIMDGWIADDEHVLAWSKESLAIIGAKAHPAPQPSPTSRPATRHGRR